MPIVGARKEVFVVGGGGREYALGCFFKRSGADVYFTAPKEAGTSRIGLNVEISSEDISQIADFAKREGIYLTVVGPEAPLVRGIVNEFQERNLPIFGPTCEAAEIEASKIWARYFLQRHGIPGPRFITFGENEYSAAREFLESDRLLEVLGSKSVVVKKDGLAAGKGAIVCDTQEEAQLALHRIMVQKEFGQAGNGVVIEERLYGREVSIMAVTDGKTVVPLLPAEDYKQLLDGDRGPNTGGMGGVCPHWEVVSPQELQMVTKQILVPIVDGMAAEGRPYQGILYAGLMKTNDGFEVLEVNCRGGDPETQLILPLLRTPLLPVLVAATQGKLADVSLRWKEEKYCVGVVLASEGYPGKYDTGKEVFGVNNMVKKRNVIVFEAGTEIKRDGNRERRVTSGGRVLMVTGLGKNVDEAAKLAYKQIATPEEIRSGRIPRRKIWFAGAHYRTDIAQRGRPRY